MNVLTSSFSLNMLDEKISKYSVEVEQVPPSAIPLDTIALIGRDSTAKRLGEILDRNIEPNHQRFTLHSGDTLYVAMPNADDSFIFYKVTV